jgi:hypothetical protein
MAPDSRSTSPVGLTVHERQESFSDEDVADINFWLDSANPPWTEVSPASSSDDIVPQKVDILCGRGREAHGHPGNRTFRLLISFHRDDYQNTKANNYTKSSIIKAVLASIREYGGRFLKKDEQTGMWCDVGDDCKYVYEKVSHALRINRGKMSQPKKTKAKDHPPTPEQDKYFQRLLANQQNIFRELLEKNHMPENFEVDEEWSGISV